MLALWEFTWNPWPTNPQTAVLNFSLTSTLAKNYGLTAVGTASANNPNFAVPTTPTSLTLPVTSATGGCMVVAMRNVGNYPVTVTMTPYQGGSAVIKTIMPGGFIIEGDSAIGSGITAISVQAVGGASAIDYFLLG